MNKITRTEINRAVEEAKRPRLSDTVIGFFSPQKVLARQHARFQMALAGGYHGGSRGRRALSEWVTTANDADGDILPDLPLLRERSRDLLRNAPLALGAINTKVTNIVGTGLKLHATIDREVLGMTDDEADEWESAVEREWALWSESSDCDIERTLKFTAFQELAFRSVLENGDALVLLPYKMRKGSPYGLKIQLIEADRLSNPEFKADDENVAGGVERDSVGAPKIYHVSDKHPGNYRDPKGITWAPVRAFGERTGRRNALHLYRKIRIGQTRGIPDLASIIEPLKQLDRYTEAEIMAAVISGMFTVFVKTEDGGGLSPMSPTAEVGGSVTDKDFKMGNGAILDLMPNESIETANPGRPNTAFDPFVLAILRQIGTALELPFEILIKHFTSSYSAARAAMLEAWKYYVSRREWLAHNLCQPVYEAWLYEAVARGRIVAPGFLNGDPSIRKAFLGARWIGPPRGQIDPTKENSADEVAEDRGWKTASENTAERGGDWKQNVRQRKKEMAMKKEAGLGEEAKPPGPPPAPPLAPPEPGEETEEEEEVEEEENNEDT